MRFHPKRRASMDQRPGPNIARAAAAVPNSSQTHLSPAMVNIFQISINATEVPAIGVHKPRISSIPAPIKSTAGIVTFIGGRSLHSLKPARTINAEPTTTRMRSNPVPGQPPANVEYKRRNDTPFNTYPESSFLEGNRYPKKSFDRHSLESGFFGGAGQVGKLQVDNPSLQANHRGVRSIIGAQFRKDAFDSTLDGLLSD